jgi:hypothetical protein
MAISDFGARRARASAAALLMSTIAVFGALGAMGAMVLTGVDLAKFERENADLPPPSPAQAARYAPLARTNWRIIHANLEARLQQLLALAESDAKLALEDRDEILWAHAYRVRFVSRHAQLRGGSAVDKPKAILGSAVAALSRLQPETGMWFHEYGNPFAVATALQALAFAKAQGEAIDEEIVARGVGALRRCRTEQGAYSYGDPGKREPRATIAAAAGRMPLCELALLQWGKSDAAALRASLAAAFEHHALLAAVRKYDDHADRHGSGGFVFWFDMLGRAEATRFVEDAAQRDLWRAQQKTVPAQGEGQKIKEEQVRTKDHGQPNL